MTTLTLPEDPLEVEDSDVDPVEGGRFEEGCPLHIVLALLLLIVRSSSLLDRETQLRVSNMNIGKFGIFEIIISVFGQPLFPFSVNHCPMAKAQKGRRVPVESYKLKNSCLYLALTSEYPLFSF